MRTEIGWVGSGILYEGTNDLISNLACRLDVVSILFLESFMLEGGLSGSGLEPSVQVSDGKPHWWQET